MPAKKPAKGGKTVETYCTEVFSFIKDGGGAAPTSNFKLSIDAEEVQEVIVNHTGLQSDNLSLYVFSFFLLSAGGKGVQLDDVKEPFVVPQDAFVKALAQALPANVDVSEVAPYPKAFKALANATNNMNKMIRTDEKKLIAFYEFMYFFSLGKTRVFESNGESDRVEIAVEVWRFFFYGPTETVTEYTKYIPFAAVDKWLEFVQTDKFTGVTLDLWRLLYRFTKLKTYDDYDPNDSWPLMLDDFVEWYHEDVAQKKKAQPAVK